MKRFLVVVFSLAVLVMLLCSCESQEATTEHNRNEAWNDAQSFYLEYLETMVNNPSSALSYRHYEDSAAQEMAMANPTMLIDYEIIRMTKLSDSLWEVILWSQTFKKPDGVYGANYIGVIDGKYYVMTGIKQIPSALKEGLDLVPYEPSGPSIIDPDDVL